MTGIVLGLIPAACICLKKATLLSPFSVLMMIAGLACAILAITPEKSVPPKGT